MSAGTGGGRPRPVRRSAGLLALVALAAGGCFRYVPVQPAVVQPQEEVRVRLTDEAAVRLARDFGRITPHLDARLEPRGADSVLVSVWIGRHYPGTQFENVHQHISLGRDELVDVRRRQLSTTRTAVATLGVIAGFVFLVDRIFQQEDPNTGNDNPPPPPPDPAVFRVRIPLGWIR